MSYHVSVYPEGLEIERLRYLILAAQREGNRSLAAGLAGLGLTPAQAEVLRMLSEHGPLSLTGLGQLLVCESGDEPESPGRTARRRRPGGPFRPRRRCPTDRAILTAEGTARAADSLIVEERLHEWMRAALGSTATTDLAAALESLVRGTAAGDAITRRYPPTT